MIRRSPLIWPPISGGGKRPRKTMTDAEPPMHLDPIRFRYRPDDIVEEEQEAPREERRRRKKGDRKPEETPKPLREEPPEEGRPKSPPETQGQQAQAPSAACHRGSAPKPRPKKPRGPKLRLEEQPEVINALPESSGQPKRNRRRRPAHPKKIPGGRCARRFPRRVKRLVRRSMAERIGEIKITPAVRGGTTSAVCFVECSKVPENLYRIHCMNTLL